MRYAAITERLVDFDISKGNIYEESVIYFKDETAAMQYQIRHPTVHVIRFEYVSLQLVAESDLAQSND